MVVNVNGVEVTFTYVDNCQFQYTTTPGGPSGVGTIATDGEGDCILTIVLLNWTPPWSGGYTGLIPPDVACCDVTNLDCASPETIPPGGPRRHIYATIHC